MDILKSLCLSFGPSGREGGVADIIIDDIEGYVDSVKVDNLGNIIAFKKGKSNKKFMISTNMDQIGVMITYIDEKGFLRFTNVGDFDLGSMLCRKVIFKDGTEGIIAGSGENDLYIDIGASDKNEAEKVLSVGDFGVFKTDMGSVGNLVSGIQGNRIGCFVLMDAIKKAVSPENDMYYVFTVQKEKYKGGAMTSAYEVGPDIAIILDTVGTKDSLGFEKNTPEIRKGAVIKIKESDLVYNIDFRNDIAHIAKENKINMQMGIFEDEKSEALEVLKSRSGVTIGGIAIPARYINTPCETVSMDDVDNTINLIVKLIEGIK
jgi:endoglucanase